MQDSTFVQISGSLAKNLEIHQDNKDNIYGIITITVKKCVGYDQNNGQAIFEERWFQAVIEDEILLTRYAPQLLEGKKVFLVGELDIIQAHQEDSLAQMIIKISNEGGIAMRSDV